MHNVDMRERAAAKKAMCTLARVANDFILLFEDQMETLHDRFSDNNSRTFLNQFHESGINGSCYCWADIEASMLCEELLLLQEWDSTRMQMEALYTPMQVDSEESNEKQSLLIKVIEKATSNCWFLLYDTMERIQKEAVASKYFVGLLVTGVDIEDELDSCLSQLDLTHRTFCREVQKLHNTSLLAS